MKQIKHTFEEKKKMIDEFVNSKGYRSNEYFADLYDLTGDEKYKKYAKRTADKLISDSYEEKKGRSFYGAWDRIDPARVVSYTGYYIGAAGAAGALLKYYSVLKNIKIADFFEYYL